jgi:hypothetical protein
MGRVKRTIPESSFFNGTVRRRVLMKKQTFDRWIIGGVNRMDEREDLRVGVDCGVNVWLSTDGDKEETKPVLAKSVNCNDGETIAMPASREFCKHRRNCNDACELADF